MSEDVLLPTQLKNFQDTQDLSQKASILTAYSQAANVDFPALIRLLREEISKAASEQWKDYCLKFYYWADYHQLNREFKFEAKKIVAILGENRPNDQKFGILKLALPHLKSSHTEIFKWLDINQNSEDPNLRNPCKRLLEYCEKKGIWDPSKAKNSKDYTKLSLQDFMGLGREEALHWLEEVEQEPRKFPTFLEWGPSASLFTTNIFILSKLVKTMTIYFSQLSIDPKRLLGLLRGFYKHEDGRVRANTMEAITKLLHHKHLSIAILSQLRKGLSDPSIRVRTIAAINLHPLEPDETPRRLGTTIAEIATADDLEGVEWALSGTNFLNLHAEQLKRARIRLEKLKEKDWVKGGWQG